jgi:hypothetical protein
MEWKWSNGIPYKKSKRPDKNNVIEENIGEQDEDEVFCKNVEESAYSSSLNHDENTWDILNQGLYNGFSQSNNKREALDNKIADRELVQQKGFNPFLNDSNYVQDISNSDMYLKPVNTTLEREKNKPKNE